MRAAALMATPLTGYPIMAGCLLLEDSWGGERFLSLYLRHEQRLLWDTFWSDYIAALPFMYFAVTAVVGAFLFLRRFRPEVPIWGLPLVFAAGGWVASFFLTSAWSGVTHGAMLMAGALLGALVSLSVASLLQSPPDGSP